MKSIPAIVEPAIDVEKIGAQIRVALAGQLDAERTLERHEKAAAAARETARMRRLEIGRLLWEARKAWPERGPNAKPWGEFLSRHGLDDATARRYMAEYRDPEGFAQRERKVPAGAPAALPETDDDDLGPRTSPPAGPGQLPPFRQLSEAELVQALARLAPDARKRVLKEGGKVGVQGGSGAKERGTWCTSDRWARAVGPWDLDPFSNPRSLIASAVRCMLEDGGDAFGGGPPGGERPGLYLTGNAHGMQPGSGIADASTRVWIQPPYTLVEEAIAHYGHTRFCALLRWSPDVAWFRALWPLVAVVAHPLERVEFRPPPGVEVSEDAPMSFPHALYYRNARDITPEVRALCILHVVDHSLDCAAAAPPALHVVR